MERGREEERKRGREEERKRAREQESKRSSNGQEERGEREGRERGERERESRGERGERERGRRGERMKDLRFVIIHFFFSLSLASWIDFYYIGFSHELPRHRFCTPAICAVELYDVLYL